MTSHRRQIGEHTYEVTMLPLAQWQQLRDAVWPTLMGLLPDVADERGADPEVLADAVRACSVLLPLQPDSYARALRLMQDYSTADGQAAPLSTVAEVWWSRTGYAELSEWFGFALEVQLVPFLRALPLDALYRLSAKARASASPTIWPTSGPSGTSSGGGTAP